MFVVFAIFTISIEEKKNFNKLVDQPTSTTFNPRIHLNFMSIFLSNYFTSLFGIQLFFVRGPFPNTSGPINETGDQIL